MEYWEKHKKAVIKYAKSTKPQALRDAIHVLSREAATFNPVIAKAIYDIYAEDGNVLDPFSGWGDRAIGALGSPRVKKYIGVDANPNLKLGYQRLKEELDHDDKITFNIQDIRSFDTDEKFDLIFTSPPYYDFEVYSDEESQSITGFNTYEEWYKGFMVPILTKLAQFLTPGGRLILHIGATNRTKTFHTDTIGTLKQIGLTMVQEIHCITKGKPYVPIWVFQ
jgi:16S rRNA G966 N2-methylase RsmD